MFPQKLPQIVSNAVTIGICLSNKIGYNSAYVRGIREIFVYNGGFSASGY